MAKLKDLQFEVDFINNKYCKNTKNHLVIGKENGAYVVGLAGKKVKHGNDVSYCKGSLGSRFHQITPYDNASNTILDLYKKDSHGLLKYVIQKVEQKKYRD